MSKATELRDLFYSIESNDVERCDFIKTARGEAAYVQVEDPVRSCDSSEFWLLRDRSVLRVANPRAVHYSPWVSEWSDDTIAGRLKIEEMNDLYDKV